MLFLCLKWVFPSTVYSTWGSVISRSPRVRLQPLLGPWELVLALDPSLSRSYHSCFLKVWIQRQFLWEPALFNPLGQWGIHCKCYKGKETTLHILSRKHGRCLSLPFFLSEKSPFNPVELKELQSLYLINLINSLLYPSSQYLKPRNSFSSKNIGWCTL